jgi:hypothetical protein
VSDFRADLLEIKDQLRALSDALSPDSLRAELLEGPSVLLIEGGPRGLIYLARQCIDIAAKTSSGAHAHVDEHSGADEGSFPIIVSLRLGGGLG